MKKGSLIDRNENIWNVPNLLTMLRMAAVVVFIVLFARGKKNAAMIVFILAAVTDVLDGYIARRFHLITSFGKLMDPLADKLMTLSALVCLTVTGYVPLWLVIIEGAKECFMVIGGCIVLRKKKLVALPIENLTMARETRIVYNKDFTSHDILQTILRVYQETLRENR